MSFGGWSITEACFNYIKDLLPEGKVILELGSGWTTGELAKYYKMYSIESEQKWVDKYDSTYIYAPIKKYNKGSTDSWWDEDEDIPFVAPEGIPPEKGKGIQSSWFDPDKIKSNLPEKYDLILVDGPNGRYGRGGFYTYLDWFKKDVPIIIDDINRNSERVLLEKVSEKLGREYVILEDKVTGVIK